MARAAVWERPKDVSLERKKKAIEAVVSEAVEKKKRESKNIGRVAPRSGGKK
jgi:hypothetical protein